ncbi:DUF1294 domain-containing protein [Flavobacterium sp.]|uniref:DUF1294 domain-containing protein n=1 Tax=Flavobacterium sp. TaxID=239 RepID=UPI00374DBCEE
MSFILIYFLIINSIGFILIGYDKKMAVANQYRISEKTLLLIVFLGGIIGSGLAMLFFRHKTSKMSYLWKFFGIIVFQVLFFILILNYKVF